MPKQSNDVLYSLIKKMSKAEKRRFKLVSSTKGAKEEKLFVQLFDVLEDMKTFDESLIFKKIPKLKKSQLSNIKAHLLKHLMSNLRHLYRSSKIDIEIRDLTDNARVYYSKGMYKAALQVLDKAKKIAEEHEMNTAYFNGVEFEKKIESQHITGSMYPKAEKLSSEVEHSLQHVNHNNQLSNLALRLYGNYLKHGHVKTLTEAEELRLEFLKRLSNVVFDELDFYGKLYFLQAHCWFTYTVQDFANYFRYARRWVEHYQDKPLMIEKETAMFLKGYHNLLNAYFTHNKYDKFIDAYKEFLNLTDRHRETFDLNCRQLVDNFEWIHGLNAYNLNAKFDEGAEHIDRLMERQSMSIENWNLHRKFTIYYKIACIYFGAKRYNDSIDYLNRINQKVYPQFRQDLQCFSRILSLIVHFDLGNLVLVKYQVKSVYRFLLKQEEIQGVQRAIFDFLKKIPSMKEAELIPSFIRLEKQLKEIRENKYEQRAFLYLDIISWLQSKIQNRPIMDIMREKVEIK